MLTMISEFVLGRTQTTPQDHFLQASKIFPFVMMSPFYESRVNSLKFEHLSNQRTKMML